MTTSSWDALVAKEDINDPHIHPKLICKYQDDHINWEEWQTVQSEQQYHPNLKIVKSLFKAREKGSRILPPTQEYNQSFKPFEIIEEKSPELYQKAFYYQSFH